MAISSEILNRLPYDPTTLKRELKKYYISADSEEIHQMLTRVGKKSLDELFDDIDEKYQLDKLTFETLMPADLEYEDLVTHLESIAQKNKKVLSFIGDGLPHYSQPEITDFICSLRGLTTAYTPYQPERSQGTLYSLWIYANAIRELTGFEAINASLYDRATCLSEAINTSTRLVKNSNVAILSAGLFPADIEVVQTLSQETKLKIIIAPIDKKSGTTDLNWIKNKIQEINEGPDKLACLAFSATNNLGILEDVDALTDLCWEESIQSISVIDPITLVKGGLKPPSLYGSKKQGSHIFVAEGQHLAIAPNFGGPGLGIFGIRYNKEEKMAIRSTAGRYVGKTKDEDGKDALCMVLSTREQHIRREKATSNICSNQSFVATIAGAALLSRGDEELSQMIGTARKNAVLFVESVNQIDHLELSYSSSPFFNEVAVKIKGNKLTAEELINNASKEGVHLGVDISSRVGDGEQHLLISFFDHHGENHINSLIHFLQNQLGESEKESTTTYADIPEKLSRVNPSKLKKFPLSELKNFYTKLSQLNLSPDDNIYPLGSCTMKYNPYINDYAASLAGFSNIHPQAPESDAQGSLEILYSIQEMFKAITGLKAVTTQPVAGAQGELVGLKMFQAYHRKNGESETRNLILIPRSAHGTNPATATMAGFETKKVQGVSYGIVTIEANQEGQIDLEQLKEILQKDGHRVAGIMVTNPNTAGILEYEFAQMSQMIHEVGGLVYMDGANMNAIAGYVDLRKIGVDAVHNNLHKTWTIPHGGGGPGDAIVAVSEKLVDFLPGVQIKKDKEGNYFTEKAVHSIGSFHRHHGNVAHKVRTYTYLRALGPDGVREMSAVAVLSARYLFEKLKTLYPTLPENADSIQRMHEFILTISKEMFDGAIAKGTPRSQVIPKIGKLFLDFGLHAPTVAFPEVYGLMVEPTESFSKKELDEFYDVVVAIHKLVSNNPEVLLTAPHFTPIKKVDEVLANKELQLSEPLEELPKLYDNPIDPRDLSSMAVGDVCEKILQAHQQNQN